MIEIKNVRGSMETVPPIEIGKDTVYIRSNITKLETEEFTGWEYDEIQYSKDEYIALIAQSNNTIQEQLLQTQNALVEIQYNNLLKTGGV